MHETDFNALFYEFENYGLTKEELQEKALEEPVVKFDFADEQHREYLTWSKEFTFAHLKVGKGAMTIGGTRIGNKLYYAVALCSPKDNFSKSKGRKCVREHLTYQEYSRKRGIFELNPESNEMPPALILRAAAVVYLSKMRHKPVWANGAFVEFRTQRRTDKKRSREARLS